VSECLLKFKIKSLLYLDMNKKIVFIVKIFRQLLVCTTAEIRIKSVTAVGYLASKNDKKWLF